MQIYVKYLTSINNSKTVIKSNWTKTGSFIQFDIFSEQTRYWDYYTAKTDKHNVEKQCEISKIDFETAKESVTSKYDLEGLHYKIDQKKMIFYAFRKESFESDEENSFAEIIYIKVSLEKVKIPHDYILLLLKQVDDLQMVCHEFSSLKSLNNKFIKDLEESCERYKLLTHQKRFIEENIYQEFIHLLNSKKKFIEAQSDVKIYHSSDHDKSDTSGQILMATKINDPKPSTSKQNNIKITEQNKSCKKVVRSTPTKSPLKSLKNVQRTPSKRLLKLQHEEDNSDDEDISFGIVSVENKEKPDSSFTNFKMKTPIKKKFKGLDDEKRRESSVELMIKKNEDEKTSGSESKDENPTVPPMQNAQQLDTNQTSMEETIIESSQNLDDFDIETSSFYKRKCLKLRLKKKEKKNAFSEETLNILDNA